MSLAVLTSNLANYNPGAGSLITLRAGTGGFALSFDQLDDNFALLMNKINDVLGVSNADTATLASTTTRVTTLEDGGLSTLIGSTKTWPHALTVTGELHAPDQATISGINFTSAGTPAYGNITSATKLALGTTLTPIGLEIQDTYTTVHKDFNTYGLFKAGLNHTGLSTSTTAPYLLQMVQGAANATDSTKWDSQLTVNGQLSVHGQTWTETLTVNQAAQIKGAALLDGNAQVGGYLLLNYLPIAAGTGATANAVWKDSNGFLRVG
jgi:hypothetical protein